MYDIIAYMNIDFQNLENELEELEKFLGGAEAYQDPDFAEKSKRASEVSGILELKKKIDSKEKALLEAKELVLDAELGELAKEDVERLSSEIEKDKNALEEMLIPNDPTDDKPAIVEIRAGAGALGKTHCRPAFRRCPSDHRNPCTKGKAV